MNSHRCPMCHSTVNKMCMFNQSQISNPQNWAAPWSEVKDQLISITLQKEGWGLFSGHLEGPGERGESLFVWDLEHWVWGLMGKAQKKKSWGLDQKLIRKIINTQFYQLSSGASRTLIPLRFAEEWRADSKRQCVPHHLYIWLVIRIPFQQMQNDCCGADERPFPHLLNLIQDDTSRRPMLEMTGRGYCPGRGMNPSHSWDWSHQAISGAALTSQPYKIHAVSLALTTC